MINRKILYFYEYASETRGRCMGHARIFVCGDMLKVSLAFSLPGWEKTPCKLYFVVEDCLGRVVVISPGDIMPCEIMTVYNLEIAASKLEGMNIKDIVNLSFILKESESRYIKAVTGCFEITLERLAGLISDKKDEAQGGSPQDCEAKEEEVGQGSECKRVEVVNTVHEKVDSMNKVSDRDKGSYGVSDNTQTKTHENCGIAENTQTKTHENCSIAEDAQIKKQGMVYKETDDSALPEVIRVRNYIAGLMSTRPEYNPFTSGKISYCVRIGVGDAINLAGYEPGLRDNSFLMHGFYRYKHLLLAGGMQKGHMNYYILVPGVKIEREQRLADMYGFHEFMSLDGQPSSRGAFGYYSWLLPS